MAAAAFSPARFTAFLAVLATFFAVGIEKAHAEDACGELITLDVRDGVTQSYALIHAHTSNPTRGVIVLMAGGGGNLALDSRGCVQQLGGNTLIRIAPHLSREGYATALVDAPSDHKGLDGLGAFRTSPEHAGDIGHVIRDLRERLDVPVHIAGSSRGTISAVNAAARLFGAEDPESVMLFSPITSGRTGGRNPGSHRRSSTCCSTTSGRPCSWSRTRTTNAPARRPARRRKFLMTPWASGSSSCCWKAESRTRPISAP